MIATLALALLTQGRQVDPAQVAMQAIQRCDRDNSGNSLSTIRAINALVALSPNRTRQVLEQYFSKSITTPHYNLYPLVICMFDLPPKGYLLPPHLGDFQPMAPSNLRLTPRYPVILSGDIPVWIATGSAGKGTSEPAGMHFQILERSARLRSKPLVPSNRPWRMFGPSPIGNYPFSVVRRNQNRAVLLLVSTAFRPRIVASDGDSPLADTPDGWAEIVAGLETSKIRWDVHREMYVRQDGTPLPPIKS